jgi:serine protease Do
VLTLQRIAPADEGPGRIKGFVGIALSVENNGLEVVIQMVLENSPAEKAGLRAGDVVLTIGNQNVGDLQTAVDRVRRELPGRELRIRVRRDGKEKVIAVKVAVFPFSLLGLLG